MIEVGEGGRCAVRRVARVPIRLVFRRRHHYICEVESGIFCVRVNVGAVSMIVID